MKKRTPDPKPDEITAIMLERGWTDLWYANPGPCKSCGPRWFCGIWTAPQIDLICIKQCSTNEEANRFLSPAGWTPLGAARLAKREAHCKCPNAAREEMEATFERYRRQGKRECEDAEENP